MSENKTNPITAPYGKVYQIAVELIKKYYPYRKCNFLYTDKLRQDMRDAGNNAAKEHKGFPIALYGQVCNVLGHWFEAEFIDLPLDEVTPLFQEVWQFHKHYLLAERTDEVWTEILAEGRRAKRHPVQMQHMYVAAIVELGRLDDEKNKAERQQAV